MCRRKITRIGSGNVWLSSIMLCDIRVNEEKISAGGSKCSITLQPFMSESSPNCGGKIRAENVPQSEIFLRRYSRLSGHVIVKLPEYTVLVPYLEKRDPKCWTIIFKCGSRTNMWRSLVECRSVMTEDDFRKKERTAV